MAKKQKQIFNPYNPGAGSLSNLGVSNQEFYANNKNIGVNLDANAEFLKTLPKEEIEKFKNVAEEFQKEQALKEKMKAAERHAEELEKQEKLLPTNPIEASLQSTMKGADYEALKRDKEEYQKLRAKTYAGLREDFHRGAMKTLPSPEEIEKSSGFKKFLKSSARAGGEFIYGLSSFLAGGLENARPKNWSNKDEDKRLDELEARINKVELPVKVQQKKDIQKEFDSLLPGLNREEKRLQEAIDKNVALIDVQASFSTGINDPYIPELEMKHSEAIRRKKYIEHLKENYQDAINRYDDDIRGAGFWGAIGRDNKSTLSVGLSDIDNAESQIDIINKLKRIEAKTSKGEESDESLSDVEQMYLNSVVIREGAAAIGLGNDNYKLGDSVRQSAMFMAEMAIVSRFTGGAGTVANSMVKGLPYLLRVGAGIGGEILATGVTASTFTKSGNAFISPLQQIEDVESPGKQKYIISDAQKLAEAEKVKKFRALNLNEIAKKEREINDLVEKTGDISDKDKTELEKLYSQQQKIEETLDSLIDEDGFVRKKERSGFDAFFSGFTENLKERLAEKYVGAGADKAFGAIGAGVMNTKAVQALAKSKVGSAANWVSNGYKSGIKKFNENIYKPTFIGSVSRALTTHIGPGKMIHSLPSEMVEEIAVQLTPTYMEDYSDQLNELTSTDFYKQVALSTMIIGAGGSLIGTGSHGLKSIVSKDYRAKYEQYLASLGKRKADQEIARERYQEIDKAITDEDLAKQIAMGTVGTYFDQLDYQAELANLRNPDFEDKAGRTMEERERVAKEIESKSFYNTAIQAIQTGTEKDLSKALNKVINNNESSPTVKKAAVNALEQLNIINKVKEEHRGKANFQDILENTLQKSMIDFTINDLQDKIIETENTEKVYDEFEKIKEKLGENYDEYSFDDLRDLSTDVLNSENNIGLNNFIANLITESPALKKYIEFQTHLGDFNERLNQVNTDFKHLISEEAQKEAVQKRNEAIVAEALNTVNSENVSEIKNALDQEDILTPELIAQLNEAAINNTKIEDSNIEEIENTEEIQSNVVEEQEKENKLEDKIKEESGFDVLKGDIIPEEERLSLDFGEETPKENKPGKEEETVFNLFDDPDSENFAPMDYDPNNSKTVKHKDAFKGAFSNWRSKGFQPDFDGVIARLRSDFPSRNVEQNFNLIATAYQEAYDTDLSLEELENVYSQNFGSPGKIEGLDFMGAVNPLTGQDLNKEVEKIENKGGTTATTLKPSQINSDNIQDKPVPEKRYDPASNSLKDIRYAEHTINNFKDTGLILGGALGLNYEETENGKVTSSTEVNENAKPFIDYRNLREGSSIKMTFNIPYLLNPENKITIWENLEALNLDGKDKPTKKVVSVKEYLLDTFKNTELNTWEKIEAELINYSSNLNSDSILFQNEEFLKTVPVGTYESSVYESSSEFNDDGTPKEDTILQPGLSSYYWFNSTNLALQLDNQGNPLLEERAKREKSNRNFNLAARNAILKNGSFDFEVGVRQDKNDNLSKEEDFFEDLSTKFGGNLEDLNKHLGMGVILFEGNSHNFYGSVDRSNQKEFMKVNGVPLTKSNVVNFNEIVSNITNKKYNSGLTVFGYQSGIDSNNKPIFTLREVISNHPNLQKSMGESRYRVNTLSTILFNENKTDLTEAQKQEFFKKYKELFGYSINTFKIFKEVVSSVYPDKTENGYRQDYKIVSMSKDQLEIPDFTQITNINHFIKDVIDGKDVPRISKKMAVARNLSSNVLMTPISNNEGEVIYTEKSQPFVIFNFNIPNEIVTVSTKEKALNSKLADKLVKQKEDLESEIISNTNPVRDRILKTELNKVQKELENIEIVSEINTDNYSSILPGNKEDNLKFIQIVSESLQVNNNDETVELLQDFISNFVDLHTDNIIDQLVGKGIIEKEC